MGNLLTNIKQTDKQTNRVNFLGSGNNKTLTVVVVVVVVVVYLLFLCKDVICILSKLALVAHS